MKFTAATTLFLSSRFVTAAFLFSFLPIAHGQNLETHSNDSSYQWNLPPGFPLPFVPANNPMSAIKVELGRHLFYEPLLSFNELYTCASCHQQDKAFTDGKAQAIGVTGILHSRSAMSLTNVAYNPVFSWASEKVSSLEQQALIPLFNTMPAEMGLTQPISKLLIRLESKNTYLAMFQQAFPEDGEWITLNQITKAISAFERTLISGNSAYDRYLFFDENDALDESAKLGMKLFFSEKTACGQCHFGINFSSASRYADLPEFPTEFHNTNLYQYYPEDDTGIHLESGEEEDRGKFRAPTLRNIALTAPYMHDGSINTLSEVIDHYAKGGKTNRTENNPRRRPLIRGFEISGREKKALIDFLLALTDYEFIKNEKFSNPNTAQ